MIIEREQLIRQLEDIRSHGFKLDEENDATHYLGSLLYYIGDTDPYLRDVLIYETFQNWIEENDYFEDEERIQIFKTIVGPNCLGAYLDSSAEKTCHGSRCDLTLIRSFSALILASLIRRHNRSAYLSDALLDEAMEKLLMCFLNETDLRGYDFEKGWVHALAHYSDALGALLIDIRVSALWLSKVLDVIKSLLQTLNVPFTAAEEERMIRALYPVLFKDENNFEPSILWVEQVAASFYQGESGAEYETQASRCANRYNRVRFIRALYFMGTKKNLETSLLEKIRKIEDNVL